MDFASYLIDEVKFSVRWGCYVPEVEGAKYRQTNVPPHGYVTVQIPG